MFKFHSRETSRRQLCPKSLSLKSSCRIIYKYYKSPFLRLSNIFNHLYIKVYFLSSIPNTLAKKKTQHYLTPSKRQKP